MLARRCCGKTISLIDRGARLAHGRARPYIARREAPNATLPGVMGHTPLLLAIDTQGEATLVVLLLSRGADPNARKHGGVTPLQLAIDVALEARKNEYDDTGVARDPSTEVVELLLRAGADPRLTDNRGRNAFDWARETGNYTAEAVLRAWAPPSPPLRLR